MLNIHKSQRAYELFTNLCIVGDSDLAGIYEYLTASRGKHCKNESIVIVISGYWEYETGLLYECTFAVGKKTSFKFEGTKSLLTSCIVSANNLWCKQ